MNNIQRIIAFHRDHSAVERTQQRVLQPFAQLQADVASTLDLLAREVDLVAELVGGRQHGIGFLTPEARTAMHAQHVADQEANRERYAMAERLRMEIPSGHGATAAPGNVAAVSVDHQINQRLRRLITDTARTLRAAHGTCALVTLAHAAPTSDVARAAKATVNLLRTAHAVSEAAEVVEDLVLDANALLDGSDRSRVAWAACPHCSQHSLVIEWREWIIRCDRPEHVDEPLPCVCNDPLCECKRRSISHRHTWQLGAGPSRSNSWHSLARQIGVPEAARHIREALADVESRKKRLARLTRRAAAHATPAAAPPRRLAPAQRAAGQTGRGRDLRGVPRCDDTDEIAAFCGCPSCTAERTAPQEAPAP